ncbi:MAG: hypothetical protein K7J46_01420 [Bryobacter sp.]|jgi:hypothetical protein|nr:hypothetical protein [Bryobacter sp. CoA8 C33]
MQKLIPILMLAASLSAADLSGKWACEVQTDAGSGSPSFEFQQTGEKLKGKYSGQLGDADVEGTVQGSTATWSFGVQGSSVVYQGKLEGAELKGKVDLAGQATGTFVCRKQ